MTLAGTPTVAEAVMAALIADLRPGLTTANGGSFDVATVLQELPNVAEVKDTVPKPAVFVWAGQEDYDHERYLTRTYVTMALNLIALRSVPGDIQAAGQRMAADLIRLLTTVNRTVTHPTGSVIAHVRPEGSLAWNGLSDTVAGCHCVFSVTFFTALGNPYAVS